MIIITYIELRKDIKGHKKMYYKSNRSIKTRTMARAYG